MTKRQLFNLRKCTVLSPEGKNLIQFVFSGISKWQSVLSRRSALPYIVYTNVLVIVLKYTIWGPLNVKNYLKMHWSVAFRSNFRQKYNVWLHIEWVFNLNISPFILYIIYIYRYSVLFQTFYPCGSHNAFGHHGPYSRNVCKFTLFL